MARQDDRPRPHLLVVDDDPELPELLACALTDDGYAVTVCHDGRDVAHLVDALQPAALIVDVLMPGTDGWTVVRTVRATPAGRRLPVVLMRGAWCPHEQRREIGSTRQMAPP